MSTNIKIAKAYSVLVIASVAGHALSMVKEIMAAGYFGVSGKMDAFYAAMTVPNLLSSVLLSPFVIIFVPILVRHRAAGLAQANRLISTVANVILGALAAAAAATFLFSGQLIALASPGLDPAIAADAAVMLKLLSAAVLFTGAANILTGIINAFEHFLWPAVSGMFVTAATILAMLLFTGELGVFTLGWGLLAGAAAQALFLVPVARRRGFIYQPVLDLADPEIRKSLDLAGIFLLITVVGSFSTVANRFLASWLPAGSIAALGYADKLVQVPLVIFSGAIATSIYPFLSAQAAGNKLQELRDTVALSVRMSCFIFLPLAGLMIVLAKPLIRLLFERGAFDAAATDLTAAVFIFYTLQLFATAAAALMQRVLFALQDFTSVLKASAAALALTTLLSYSLMRVMDPPACGIALSASAGALFLALALFAAIKRRLGNLHGLAILGSFARIAAFSVCSALAAHLAHRALAPALPAAPAAAAAALLAASAAGLAVFAALAALFRLEEFKKVSQLAATRFGRRAGA